MTRHKGVTLILVIAAILAPALSWGFLSKTGKVVALSSGEFAVLTTDGTIHLVSRGGGISTLCTLPSTRGGLTPVDMAADPNESSVFTLLSDGEYSSMFTVCRLGKEGPELHSFPFNEVFSSIAAIPNGIAFASSRTGAVFVWPPGVGSPILIYRFGAKERITSLGYDRSTKLILALDGGSGLIYPILPNGILGDPAGRIEGAVSISIDAVGHSVYGITQDGSVTRIPKPTAWQLNALNGAAGLAVSVDGDELAVLGYDDILRIFNANDGRQLQQVNLVDWHK
jgi:WD40 repeat protein